MASAPKCSLIPILLAGKRTEREPALAVTSPYDGRELARVSQANEEDARTACTSAASSFAETRKLAAWQRESILRKISERILSEHEPLAQQLSAEAGKPIADARLEVTRAIQTFHVAAEESKRIPAEILPLDWTPDAEQRSGFIRRVAIGPVLGITPFNFPLNLVAHKIAPAIAAGNPIIIKPAPQTPLSALRLGEIVVDSGWPASAISVLPCNNEIATLLLQDEQVKLLSFTGSADVGWRLKAAVPRKKVVLELGGNAACIVHSDADLDLAAQRIVAGGCAYAGQSCISVQRVFAHEEIAPKLVARLKTAVAKLTVGDPASEATQVGPMINESAAIRAEDWIREAVAAGAQLHTGGTRTGSLFTPSLLTDVPLDRPLASEEAFAPVVFVNIYSQFDAALDMVNRSRYGLQAAVFTQTWPLMAQAWRVLDVGAVLVNESTSWRAEHMPYGGMKDSGVGREGLRAAIEEMTEPRMMILHT